MRKFFRIIFCVTLVVAVGCTKRDADYTVARQVEHAIIDEAFDDFDHAWQRMDSAEQAGLFTAAQADNLRAIVCMNTYRYRMAAHYAEKAIEAQGGQKAVTPIDSNIFCLSRWVLAGCAYYDGDYGKSIQHSKEILSLATNIKKQREREMRGRALVQMAECEEALNHIDEAEELYLECLDMHRVCLSEASNPWDLDPLIFLLLAINDLYLDHGMPEKALALVPLADTALSRLENYDDEVGDYVGQMRRNNLTISKAMVYAANGRQAEAETLFQEHRQSEGLQDPDLDAEGLCMSLLGRYDEAIRLYDEADSIRFASGEPLTNSYVEGRLTRKYEALQKAGRTAEALALGDRIRQLTDSLRREERQVDIAQIEEIARQEEALADERHAVAVHRMLLWGAMLLLAVAGYGLWRFRRYNKQLAEKNRRLYEQIRQREQAEESEKWRSESGEALTQNQQLYRRLCELMQDSEVYADAETNHETLARLAGTNRTYVYDALHECANLTPADFINMYRIRHAAHLLTTTDEPVGLIIEESGITSRSTFSRLFREHYSMSPTEFRKASKQQE